ncbi:hypothetical protein HHI36_002667 [Cryptolaemus montrouzieri]|uniref:AB hydrolase-1 domain-containing protein n=1 Tax=Cryptolaemus montrouzieri TaxID=559131 RepID=A0ABD2PB45_9CUCU
MEEEKYLEYQLIETEQKILSNLSSYKIDYVPIKTDFGTDEKVWTLSLNTKSPNTPLVMLHGFAAGIGFWCLNFEPLAKDRPVYAIDVLGFGRSSRPKFSKDSDEAERQMVDALEAWRKQMKLEKIILLGHSMGAFLSASYAISYPQAVEHLIFADAWGFSDKYENPPLLLKIIAFMFGRFNPLGFIRSLGPYWGPLLLQKTRRDVFGNFAKVVKDDAILPKYIYLCNALENRTGERAFISMVLGVGWAKSPIVKRISNLKESIPLTFMYGSHSWMDKEMAPRIKAMRPNSYVDIEIIQNAGHHIYSEQADVFNEIVIRTCKTVDQRIAQSKKTTSKLDHNENKSH